MMNIYIQQQQQQQQPLFASDFFYTFPAGLNIKGQQIKYKFQGK